ncbi:hypothetical protein EJ07DRAFT_105810, partial [Lizonia empirigonia]
IMVSSLLFRWEDSQALQHHCGFCERPLSHPEARARCFGTHSEPCHRFHQIMFMRLRSHMCNYCQTIDEAHYKRHHELVAKLRSIYESCGEVDWTIVPAEPGEPNRDRPVDPRSANSRPSDPGLLSEETLTSRRERKNAKSLRRAANRAKVVTQDEIRYIDSVLHTAESGPAGVGADPANLEELQLIENHLRYNANVFNNHSSRSDLKKFAKIPDVDVDFDGEMGRVLHTFRITEIVQRNLRNRGLQGRELKDFETSVEAFKVAIVEDLVLVKKDMMEIRMQRAGYLRYTNRTAYGIVEDRYTDTNWKTGERIGSCSSVSSSLTTPSDDSGMQLVETPDVKAASAPLCTQGPDRRHLLHVHTRVSGHDGLEQEVIEPYHAPLLPLTPNEKGVQQTASQPTCNLEQEISPSSSPSSRSIGPALSKKPDPSVRPAWGRVTTVDSDSHAIKISHTFKHSILHEEDFPALGSTSTVSKLVSTGSDAPAVQAPAVEKTMSLRGPERPLEPENDIEDAHPISSQKKIKKSQREAKRKAKKVSEHEETSNPVALNEFGRKEVKQALSKISPSVLMANCTLDAKVDAILRTPKPESGPLTYGAVERVVVVDVAAPAQQLSPIDTPVPVTPPTLPCTTHRKHDSWTRFARFLVIDQLTNPYLQSSEDCSHESICLFESLGVTDCPFHKPHCPCDDPLRNICCLMHPSEWPFTSGPLNRAYGERLMATYQQHEETKDRVMLVDCYMALYLISSYGTSSEQDRSLMPFRLVQEHKEYQDGFERGPLMKQELDYKRKLFKNMITGRPLTIDVLQGIHSRSNGSEDSIKMCYCITEVQNMSEVDKELGTGIVECSYRECKFGGYFHKDCVKKLGVEKVSRWYCTSCEKEMKILAHRTLNISCVDSDAYMDCAKEVAEMILKHSGARDLIM